MVSSDRKSVYEADQFLLEGSVLFLWEITDFPQALKCCSIQPDPQGWSRAEIHEKSPGQLQLHLFLKGINCFTQLYLPKGLQYFRASFQTENSQGRSLGNGDEVSLPGKCRGASGTLTAEFVLTVVLGQCWYQEQKGKQRKFFDRKFHSLFQYPLHWLPEAFLKIPEMQLHTISGSHSLTWDIIILHFLIMIQGP